MGQTKEGAVKWLSRKFGMSVEEIKSLWRRGLKRCYRCKSWKRKHHFKCDTSRFDKRAACCRECSSIHSTASRYQIRATEVVKMRSGSESCDICGRKAKLQQDHCHRSGNNRGRLCGKCNRGLGNFNDNQHTLRKAAAYLEKHNG